MAELIHLGWKKEICLRKLRLYWAENTIFCFYFIVKLNSNFAHIFVVYLEYYTILFKIFVFFCRNKAKISVLDQHEAALRCWLSRDYFPTDDLIKFNCVLLPIHEDIVCLKRNVGDLSKRKLQYCYILNLDYFFTINTII